MSRARMIVRLAAASLSLIVATAAPAHDFWLQPTSCRVEPAATAGITLRVGHGPDRRRSPIRATRIQRFESVAPDGRRTDQKAGLNIGGPADDATLAIARPGTHVLLLETDDGAQSHLPAARFNRYLDEEGLAPAIALRERTGRTGRDGSERYSRHARAIVQIGPVDPLAQAEVTRPLGLNLEIVPERSPLASERAAGFPVRVFYQGQPLAGALVKLTDLAHDAGPIETRRTDGGGRAMFGALGRGNWLLATVWTRPLGADDPVDFDSDFASLSFCIPD